MSNPEFCSYCGKQFKKGDKAIAITGGTIDYINYLGFRPNDDAYVEILCIKCSDKKRKIKAVLEEFVKDVESVYDSLEVSCEWPDLAITFEKAKKLLK